MGIMTTSISDTIETRFRKAVAMKFGTNKGALQKGIEFGMQKLIEEVELENLRKSAVERLEKGYKLGKLLYKSRDELYDRD